MNNASLKSKNQLLVELMMAKIGTKTQPLPTGPTIPDEKTRILRARLMLEECLETIQKGLAVDVTINEIHINMDNAAFNCSSDKVDLVEVADGLADCEVVNLGTAASCGLAHQPFFEEVASNNLLKFAPGHSISEHGKLIKPPDHPKPDLEKIMKEQYA